MGDYGEICLFIVAWGYTASLLCLLVGTSCTKDECESAIEDVKDGDFVRYWFRELVDQFQISNSNDYYGKIVKRVPLYDYMYDGKCLFILRGDAKSYDYLHLCADKLLTSLIEMESCQPLIENLWGLSRFEYDAIEHTKPFTAKIPTSFSSERYVLLKGAYDAQKHVKLKENSIFCVIEELYKTADGKRSCMILMNRDDYFENDYVCNVVNDKLSIVLLDL